MEDDSPAQPLTVSFPIEGMERVVATVSGYSGMERFNLIKLISKAGANYVGRMSQSITHLVCWKYEGTKYQLARGFKTLIVNHQWIEDSVKAGRRLPEYPYTFQCGQELGPLKLRVPLISEKIGDPNWQNNQKQEKRNYALPEPSHGSRRRRLVKKSNIKETLVVSSDSEQETTVQEDFHKLYNGRGVSDFSISKDKSKLNVVHAYKSTFFECGQNRSEGLVSEKKRNSALAEPSHRGRRRRLVKKNISEDTSSFISESKEASRRLEDFDENYDNADASNLLLQKNECRLRALHECGVGRNEGLNDIDNTEDVIDVLKLDDEGLHAKGVSSDHVSDNHPDRNDTEPTAKLPTTLELSCVICWTNFSVTRGVLPCGHRFCFSCIQSWVDYMATSGKTSTCPLCKAAFSSITKVDDAVHSDQKIYSQTIPVDDSRMERIPILPDAGIPNIPSRPLGAPVCCHCSCREPEDLLQRCNICWIQCIHSYCLDPPLLPWTCGNCKELQRLYQHIR